MHVLKLLAFNFFSLMKGTPKWSLFGSQLAAVKIAQHYFLTKRGSTIGKILAQPADNFSRRRINLVLHLAVDDHHAFIHLIDDALQLSRARFLSRKRCC